MNQQCYRVVFNRARAQMMAVPETAIGQHKAASGTRRTNASAPRSHDLQVRASAWVALVLLGFGQPLPAQIIADPNAPSNQRPTILNSANGTPQVNIQTPSAAGVSRNTYRQFDVDGRGAILNNSRTSTQTQLGGWVQGNPWLANGSARVILNEVNSTNPAQLRGFVEVAGNRAQVVIASPAGIVCDGCGFINANRATLTTGAPQVNDGNLESYRVTGGNIRVEGAGMDARQTDYTDLIARSVQLNAGVWANEFKATTGANEVDAAHTAAASITGTGAAPTVGIDVSQLGGMYTNKITLVGTEAGVGVRNAGTIGAQAGDVVVQANGMLTNSGTIQARGNVDMHATGIANSGLVGAQAGAISLQTDGLIDNRMGTINATGNVDMRANALTNARGSITSVQGQTTVTTRGTVDNTAGRIEAGGDVAVSATGLNTSQGAVLGQSVRLDSGGQALNNDSGTIAARSMLDVRSSVLSNQSGLLQSSGNMTLDTNGQSLINTNAGNTGGIVSEGALTIATGALDNRAGFIGSRGEMRTTATTIDNTSQGVINGEGNVALTASALDNRSGTVQALGNLDARIGTLDNRAGLMLSGQTLTANAGILLNGNTNA